MKTMHALLVDDDTQALETMGMILEMDDYRVSTAANGLSALERLEAAEENPPNVDFLILDLDMDRLSGIKLLMELRHRGHTLPVMVVSGYASKNTVVELMRHGVSDFLDKPIHLEEFRSRVQRIAREALRRRKSAEGRPAPPSPPVRAATVLDLGNLGVPYSLRRMMDPSPQSSLLMAARKPFGFEILLADVTGAESESFYLSVLVKTFFDGCRGKRLTGPEMLWHLNRTILEGSLKRQQVRAILLRVLQAEKRVEILPAGLPSQCFTGLGEGSPRLLSFCGSPLGMDPDPACTQCILPFNSRDRLFVFSERNAPAGEAPGGGAPGGESCLDPHFETACLRESVLRQESGSLQEIAEGIWKEMRPGTGGVREKDAMLLGLELS